MPQSEIRVSLCWGISFDWTKDKQAAPSQSLTFLKVDLLESHPRLEIILFFLK